MAGTIETFYEATCNDCQLTEHPPAKSKKDAEKVLKSWGWTIKKGMWTCQDCSKK